MNIRTLIRKPFRYEFWNASLVLIGVNLLAFLLIMVSPDWYLLLALSPRFILENGMIWQVFTYQFVHGGISHLVFNMLGLFFFGMAVERRLGSREFLFFYLGCATLSGAASLGVYLVLGMVNTTLLGASGGVFALLLAFAVLNPRAVIYIWGIVPVPAPLLVLAYAVIELFSLVTGSASGISHGTHLAGFAAAWLYFRIRMGVSPLRALTRG